MASLNSNNIIPFIIICFCLLIFIGILRNKKVEKINNIMEQFINSEIINSSLDKTFSDEYISGLWTTPGTTLNKEGFSTQLMEFTLKNKNGFIQLPNIPGNIYFNGLKYNITLAAGMTIAAKSDQSQYTLSISIINISEIKDFGKYGLNPTDNIPLSIVKFIDKNDNILSDTYSYKVPEHKKIEPGRLKDLIESKSFNGYEIKDQYNIPSYIKIIGDYRFLPNTISLMFGVNTNSSSQINNYYNIIKNKYGGNISFRIAREFTAPNGSTIKTHSSDIYTLNSIIGNPTYTQSIPNKINIFAPIKDLVLNKINYKEYVPKSTIIYFYKVTNTSINYNFANSNKLNNANFNFDNNDSTMFSNDINSNDLNSLTKNINSSYTITFFKTVFTPDINKDISIPFSDLYNLL